MEPRVTTKDVNIGDRSYRLSKTDPRTGCWLFSVLASKTQEGQQLVSALGSLPRETFNEIQATALRLVSRIDFKDGKDLTYSIISPKGEWVDKELESNVAQVMEVTSLCIMFNLDSFFVDPTSINQS